MMCGTQYTQKPFALAKAAMPGTLARGYARACALAIGRGNMLGSHDVPRADAAC